MSRGKLRLADLIEESFASIGANFLRSSLTILGISIGVFSVVGVMTALTAVRQSIDSSLNVFGANVLMVSKEPGLKFGPTASKYRNRKSITPRQAESFKRRMDEEGLPTALSVEARDRHARYAGRKTETRMRIVGTNEHYIVSNKYMIDFGRNLTPADIEFNRPVVVLGKDVLDELFVNEDPIGKEVILLGDRYTVVGALESKGNLFGFSMDSVALIPYSKFIKGNWNRNRSMNLSVQAGSVAVMQEVAESIIGNMRAVRSLQPEDENDFEITSNEALQSVFGEIAFYFGVGGVLISGIALVCAGIGIMNIMLVSVTERTREIGVRKALGARKQGILTQFLLEAVLLSQVGAAIGIMLGIVAGNVIAVQFKAEMILPWFWIGAAVSVCCLIGIGFGFFPAVRAANLRPVDSLRQD